MFIPASVALLLLSAQVQNTPGVDEFEAVVQNAHASDWGNDPARLNQLNAFRERRFQMKYNAVAKALAEFGDGWNRSHRFDPGKFQQVKKAWRDLQKAEPWFNISAK